MTIPSEIRFATHGAGSRNGVELALLSRSGASWAWEWAGTDLVFEVAEVWIGMVAGWWGWGLCRCLIRRALPSHPHERSII